jgi:hypothetical protein
MSASGDRLREEFEGCFGRLAGIGRDPAGGWTRLAWTEEDCQARAWFEAEAAARGLTGNATVPLASPRLVRLARPTGAARLDKWHGPPGRGRHPSVPPSVRPSTGRSWPCCPLSCWA